MHWTLNCLCTCSCQLCKWNWRRHKGANDTCVLLSWSGSIYDSIAQAPLNYIRTCRSMTAFALLFDKLMWKIKLHSYFTASQLYNILMYQSVSTTTQCNALHLRLKLKQYQNEVVGAEMEIWPLQLSTTQIEWNMNKALHEVNIFYMWFRLSDNLLLFKIW